LDAPKPMTAFVGTLYVGTDRLGRPLTDPEKNDLTALLRRHDFVGASMVALRFAFKLRRSKAAAQDLQGRANLRLIRLGWDPREVPLVKRLCRLVYSEHTNERSESETARKAEEVFVREHAIQVGRSAPSAEDAAAAIEAEREAAARGRAKLESLRALFTEAKDEVNLVWLNYSLDDIDDLGEMARLSGRDVKDFYLAADRRKRHVRRLLARTPGAERAEATSEEDE